MKNLFNFQGETLPRPQGADLREPSVPQLVHDTFTCTWSSDWHVSMRLSERNFFATKTRDNIYMVL